MQINIIITAVCIVFATGSCTGSTVSDKTVSFQNKEYILSDYTDVHKISHDSVLPLDGAAKSERRLDIKNSPYFTSYDFYNMESEGTLVLLKNFKTIQQATEVTCGPACVLMVLEYFGKKGNYNEKMLKELQGTDQDTTYLRHLLNIFEAVGGFKYVSTFDYKKKEDTPQNLFPDYLKRDIPVIVGSNEWEGHWQVVIGYDTMGTETKADDILILADPYDTTDHNQDGYIIRSFCRFYEDNWKNRYDPDFDRGLFLAEWPE
ncbi:C39 family peptidase [Proteiniphilum acetatigenes]|uniref:C39 family peptidase n=1 Tax=Proteiniphilum acetatigenes TaxID=294710 RepID=UPI00036F55EB|nr:papain-like cysteine protease family protein [Proteiniphilum acetatigenes]SEA13023.1 Papain-like cysteine protease AvrRpt2 [Porphyromonadaceae bacterium KH3R12]